MSKSKTAKSPSVCVVEVRERVVLVINSLPSRGYLISACLYSTFSRFLLMISCIWVFKSQPSLPIATLYIYVHGTSPHSFINYASTFFTLLSIFLIPPQISLSHSFSLYISAVGLLLLITSIHPSTSLILQYNGLLKHLQTG
jgi:hypothetical protein